MCAKGKPGDLSNIAFAKGSSRPTRGAEVYGMGSRRSNALETARARAALPIPVVAR